MRIRLIYQGLDICILEHRRRIFLGRSRCVRLRAFSKRLVPINVRSIGHWVAWSLGRDHWGYEVTLRAREWTRGGG